MFELDEQQRMVQQMVRAWCEAKLVPKIPAMEAGDEAPFDLMKSMARTFGIDAMVRGALAKRVARLREAEGMGDSQAEGDTDDAGAVRDPMTMYVVVKELSRCSPGFAMGFGVSAGLAAGAIMSKGTAAQIERWGIPLATVERIGSWCLTEPGAGSDAFGSMRTTARRDGDGFVLDGSKTFITNGPGADVFVVYARLLEAGAAPGERGERETIEAFVVERDTPGLTIGAPLKKMGMRDSPTCELFFDELRLPAEHLLGLGKRGGRGAAKRSLGSERSGIPAMAWGIIEKCYEQSLAYARERRQFGRPIGEFQAIQLKLADMYVKLRNVENIVFRTAWMQQRGVRDPAFVDASKAYCSMAAGDVALTAVQIHGGYGYMQEYHVEKLARDARLLELGAGTTDINLLSAARHELGLSG